MPNPTLRTSARLMLFVAFAAIGSSQPPGIRAQAGRQVFFVENHGQAPATVLWQARGAGFQASFERNAFVLHLISTAPADAAAPPPIDVVEQRIALVGANPDARLEPMDALEGKISFFRGADSSRWIRGLPSYARLRYKNVYPGIDLLFYGNQGKLEYDFVVAPGADPAAIRLRVDDPSQVQLTSAGELKVGDGTSAVLHRPLLYQNEANGKKVIEGRFTRLADGALAFRFADYDASKTLVIDPTLNLLYSTYLGGPHDEVSSAIALDSHNNAYILGYSASEDYPVGGNAYQPTRQNLGHFDYDLVLTKFSPSGTLMFSTFLGGVGADTSGAALLLDAQGNAFFEGYTKSLNFPVTSNAYQKTYPNGAPQCSVFGELSSDGSSLLYSSYYGGTGGSTAYSAALTATGTMYLAGSAGPGLPQTAGAYMSQITTGTAAFVASFDLTKSGAAQLTAASYYGAANPIANSVTTGNLALAMLLDASGNPWIAGQTYTNNIPVSQNALQATLPAITPSCQGNGVALNSAAYVAKLSADLKTLIYASYLSGKTSGAQVNSCSEYARNLARDASGNIYVTGATASASFPTTAGVVQPTYPGASGAFFTQFVSKLSADGTQLLWSSYLGGNAGSTFPNGVVLDGQGNVWTEGLTQGGSNFPISTGAYQAANKGGFDGYLTELSNDGTHLLYSTYLGGSGSDAVNAIAFDSANNIYVTGQTASTNFPVTANALQPTFANGDPVYDGNDIFFLILGSGVVGSISPPVGGNTGDTTITISGAGFQAGATCALVSGNTTIQASAVKIAANGTGMTCTFALNNVAPGSYSVVVTNTNGATFQGQQAFQVVSGGVPAVWSNIVGRSKIRTGVPSNFVVTAGNSGTADALFTVLWVALDPNVTYTLPGGLVSPGVTNAPDYQGVAAIPDPTSKSNILGFLIPVLKAGESVSIPIQVTATNDQASLSFSVIARLPWFTSRAAALAELTAYKGNIAQIPQVCQPTDATGSITDCAGYWIRYVANGASRVDIEDSPITGAGNPAGNPATLQSYITNITAALSASIGGAASTVNLPAVQTSGSPALGIESAVMYLASLGYGLPTTGGSSGPVAGHAGPSRAHPDKIFICDPQILGVAVNYDTSACLAGVKVREWRQHYIGSLGPNTTCQGDLYFSTTEDCNPFLPLPGPNKCPTFSPGAINASSARVDTALGGGSTNDEGGASCSSSGGSIDPNDKTGSGGDGTAAKYLTAKNPITYNIAFENQPSATLPAAQVVISDQLDITKVDVSTLTLGTITFGTNVITLPSGTSDYTTVYKLNSSLSVRIQGSVNPTTGLLKWTFTSIDPTTGLPPSDPTLGFLPPDSDGIKGQGSVVFSVTPKTGLATGTTISNQASIVFDANAAIPTPIWTNTLDNTPPSSAVTALGATQTSSCFLVSWSGTDVGSGIASYNIYVSDNGGPFTVWLAGVTTTSAIYSGKAGHSYGFYSVAQDRAGNLQTKTTADTTTTVGAAATCSIAMSLNRTTLNFAANGGFITDPQSVTLTFSGANNISWSASSNQPNITVTPTSGTGNALLQVTAAAGSSGVVTISAQTGNSPQTIQINDTNASAGSPFGSFDTPANNTTGVTGAIAVTGWALDNVEIANVDIWREKVGSEPVAANGLVFIGNAVFVNDARPDVAGAYSNTPFNYRAGWGYLMLTTGLPGTPAGNGTYKLHAIAHNKAGTAVDLGTKTITVDNAHSVKPFGTIDTPDQGGTVSGAQFINFGWALAQNPNCIPTDGSTLTVTVDGVPLGHPVYNQNRADLAAAFPGRCNSTGAAGYLFIDTTKLTNGVHTIGWLAYDDHGNGDGLGSRFLNVFNSGSQAAPDAQPIAAAGKVPEVVDVEELDRMEIPAGAVSGYMLANGERKALPAGSSLHGGTFYWQLAPVFHGEYKLVFEQPDGKTTMVLVRVHPRRYR